MYSNIRHTLFYPLTLLAIAASTLAACVDEDDLLSPVPAWDQGLLLRPVIEGSAMTTRAYDYYDNNSYAVNDDVPADDELLENDLGTTLDVFIAGQGSDPFWMQYHLVKGQVTANGAPNVAALVANETPDLLSKNWSNVSDPNGNRLVRNRKYDVYVAVNNTATNAQIASKADLLALTHSNSIVHKIYGSTSTGTFDANRRMLMDGHTEWTCTGEALQTIDVPLRRAEVKVVVTVDISPAFLAQLREDTGLQTPIGTPTAAIPFNGAPQWKYVNWAMDTKVFAVGNDITPELHTDPDRESMTENTVLNDQTYFYYYGKEKEESGELSTSTDTEVYFTDNADDTDEYGRRYTELYPVADQLSDGHSVQLTADAVPRARLITYTYASSWGDEAQDKAPYILVSYPFYRKKAGVTEVTSSNDITTSYNYYRIPVCDERKNSELKRNYIYKVNAIISGAGSTSFTENETPVNLHYEVLPWTHETNEEVKVKGEKFHYFYVTPTTYNLRGNDTQSTVLDYYAAKGDVVKFRNLQVYYYNSSGTKVNIYTSTNNENSNGLTTKSLANNNAGQNYSITINDDGTIDVSSQALDNRAVKYISFQAYMTYVDENNQTKTITQDIFIKHFPLDNIQNIEGWFSYKQDGGTARTIREYSWDPQADGWDSYDGYENDVEVTAAEYALAVEGKHSETVERATGTPSNYDRASNAESGRNGSQLQTAFRNAVPQDSRGDADSENNAYKDPNSNYWYWGTGSIRGNWNNYDWSTWTAYYRYETYNRRIYYKNETVYYARRYYRDRTVNTNWVVWNIDSQNRYYSSKTVYDDIMYAKVFMENDYIWNIGQTGNSTYGYLADYDERSYTNNHMYIVQISSTSDDYILGRPQVNETTHQSQDHVVSPAFMIASQLGALSINRNISFNASDAATHCSQYVEVAQDGTTYTGWRLPTKEEVSIIIRYQNDIPETMAEVLTAKHYYTLDGDAAVNPNPSGNTSNTRFVRCIRDLSPVEINSINSKQ